MSSYKHDYPTDSPFYDHDFVASKKNSRTGPKPTTPAPTPKPTTPAPAPTTPAPAPTRITLTRHERDIILNKLDTLVGAMRSDTILNTIINTLNEERER